MPRVILAGKDMKIRNCSRCGQIYQSTNPTLCATCATEADKEFFQVRNFIKENPKVSIEVVAEATGVEMDRIREFLRLGQLEAADLNGPALECKRCGKPIHQGDYCVLCRGEISENFKGPAPPEPEKKKEIRHQDSFIRTYRGKKW